MSCGIWLNVKNLSDKRRIIEQKKPDCLTGSLRLSLASNGSGILQGNWKGGGRYYCLMSWSQTNSGLLSCSKWFLTENNDIIADKRWKWVPRYSPATFRCHIIKKRGVAKMCMHSSKCYLSRRWFCCYIAPRRIIQIPSLPQLCWDRGQKGDGPFLYH